MRGRAIVKEGDPSCQQKPSNASISTAFSVATSPKRSADSKGMGERGDPVVTMHYKDLGAVVSLSPEGEYKHSRRNMLNHTKVLEEVMERHSILPVRFNTISPDRETLERLLVARYDELLGEGLERMDGKVEMGVKALWYEGIVFEEILAARADIRQLRDSLQGKSPEKTYYERIRLGEMVEEAVRQKRSLDEDVEILTTLSPFAVQFHASEIFRRAHDRQRGLSGQKRDREPEMDAAIRTLDAQQTQRVLFRYVGPVPPITLSTWSSIGELIMGWLSKLSPFRSVCRWSGALWTARKLAEHAEEVYLSDTPVRAALMELEMKLTNWAKSMRRALSRKRRNCCNG